MLSPLFFVSVLFLHSNLFYPCSLESLSHQCITVFDSVAILALHFSAFRTVEKEGGELKHMWGLPTCINLSASRNSTRKESAVHTPQQPLRFPQQHAAKSFSRLRPLAKGLAQSRCRQLANRRAELSRVQRNK